MICDPETGNLRTVYDTIADNAANAGVVTGEQKHSPKNFNLKWVGSIVYRNGEVEETGLGGGVLGDPVKGIIWLVNRLSDYNQKIATPLQTLDKSKQGKLIDALESIIAEYDIKGIIIGNPINMDGTYGKSSQSAKDIAINISNKIDIPVSLWDERLSTVGAFNLSSELDINVSKREKDIDKFAAAFILQGALDFIQN